MRRGELLLRALEAKLVALWLRIFLREVIFCRYNSWPANHHLTGMRADTGKANLKIEKKIVFAFSNKSIGNKQKARDTFVIIKN